MIKGRVEGWSWLCDEGEEVVRGDHVCCAENVVILRDDPSNAVA
jgi:hypothetical protein